MLIRLYLLLVAGAGPLAFPLAQKGYTSLHVLLFTLVLPAAALLLAALPLLGRLGRDSLARFIVHGAAGGALATFALEAVRYPGFRLGFMPGNLPRLMGVLLADRFALGPSSLSDLTGFAYHFWNGACFGIIFALLAAGRARAWAVPYGLVVGAGFLASPVVQAMGGGFLGLDFGWRFVATVLAAHAAYGAALGGFLALAGLPSSQAGAGIPSREMRSAGLAGGAG